MKFLTNLLASLLKPFLFLWYGESVGRDKQIKDTLEAEKEAVSEKRKIDDAIRTDSDYDSRLSDHFDR